MCCGELLLLNSVVGGAREDHKVAVGLILESDELQVFSFAFEEANQGKEALGLEVDGGELMSIDPKLLSALHNGILHEEEGMETQESGFGNHWGFHVLDEDMSILIFEAEKEGVVSTKHSRVLLHPLHGILMFLLEAVSHLPVREESSNFQSGEQATISLALGLEVLLPPVAVDNLVAIGQLGELKVVLLIEQGEALVLEHERSEEEASLVVHINLSDVLIPIGSGSEVSKRGEAVHSNLSKRSQQRMVDNSGEELSCGSCDLLSCNSQSFQITNGGSNGGIGLVDKWIAFSRFGSLENEVGGGTNQGLTKLSDLNRSSGRAKGVHMEDAANALGKGRLIVGWSFVGSDGSHKGRGSTSGRCSRGSGGSSSSSNPIRTMWKGRGVAASLPSKGVGSRRGSSRQWRSRRRKCSSSGRPGDGRERPWAHLGRLGVKRGASGLKSSRRRREIKVLRMVVGNAHAFRHFPVHVALVTETAGVVGHVKDYQALIRHLGCSWGWFLGGHHGQQSCLTWGSESWVKMGELLVKREGQLGCFEGCFCNVDPWGGK